MSPAVSDPADVRVLIPRMRRALDGPQATSSASVAATMNDDELTGVIADAIASVVFYSGSAWGKQLIVTERDTHYLAPVAWKTSQPLSEAEATVVVAQAAIDYYYRTLSEMKVQETIADEGQRWSWNLSATAVSERIKALQKARDEALEMLRGGQRDGVAWESFLAVRDAEVSHLIEPWLHHAGGRGGQNYDHRFGTPY